VSLSRCLKPPPARLPQHDPASTLLWMAPTSTHHCPCPRSYTCSSVPTSGRPMRGSPWFPRALNVRLDTASDPGEYQRRSPLRSTGCCLPGGQTRRHSPTKIFGAQHLQGRLHPLPLHLACLSGLRTDSPVTRRAARLNTGLAAQDYPGGIHTR